MGQGLHLTTPDPQGAGLKSSIRTGFPACTDSLHNGPDYGTPGPHKPRPQFSASVPSHSLHFFYTFIYRPPPPPPPPHPPDHCKKTPLPLFLTTPSQRSILPQLSFPTSYLSHHISHSAFSPHNTSPPHPSTITHLSTFLIASLGSFSPPFTNSRTRGLSHAVLFFGRGGCCVMSAA
jgi:hypothetical protein